MSQTAIFSICVALVVLIVGGFLLAKLPRLFMLVCYTAAALILCIFVAVTGALSRPKPADKEPARPGSAEVLWTGPAPGGIDILLTWPGSEGPRLYTLRLSPDETTQLRQAMTKAKAGHQQLRIRDPFGPHRGATGAGEGEQDGEDSDAIDGGTPGQHGGGRGPRTGDNGGADDKFYSPPPPPLPEKQ